MITEIFNEVEVIDKRFENWIQVVDFVREIFVNKKWSTKEYFEHIIKDMIETKSYMVLAPGVVLLHSSPKNGAVDDAFHFIKLKYSVNFDHEHNDPVYAVITFSVTDAKKHIESIQRLAYLLIDEEFMNEIRQNINRDELVNILCRYEKKTLQ